MTMSITQAIKVANGRVSIVSMGDQYVVQQWSPKHNATWQSDLRPRDVALVHAWEAKLRLALELYGLESADMLAHFAVERVAGDPKRPDWRAIARDIALRGAEQI